MIGYVIIISKKLKYYNDNIPYFDKISNYFSFFNRYL